MKVRRVGARIAAVSSSVVLAATLLGTVPAAANDTDTTPSDGSSSSSQAAAVTPAASQVNTPAATSASVAADPVTADRVVSVSRPFKVSDATGDGRLAVVSESDSSVRVYSAKPRTVKFQLVKTRDKSQRQAHTMTVRLKKGVTFVRGLEAGRTYRVQYAPKKHLRITPIRKVADVTGVDANFTTTRTQADVTVQHVAEWTRGGSQNTMYRWVVTAFGEDVKARGAMVSSGGTTVNPATVIELPERGHFRLDIVAMNPLGASSMTLFSQDRVEQAWAARGPAGEIRLAALPPTLDVEIGDPGQGAGEVEPADFGGAGVAVDPNEVNTNGAINAAVSAELAAQRAQQAAVAAGAAGSDQVNTHARDARDAAAQAREYASLAADYAASVPTSFPRHSEAIAAAERADAAADTAEEFANEASMYALRYWHAQTLEAAATTNSNAAALTTGASAAQASGVIDSATVVRDRANRAAAHAADVTSTDPSVVEEITRLVGDVDDAADTTDAAAAMARTWQQLALITDDVSGTQATAAAAQARAYADAAAVSAAGVTGEPFATQAAQYAAQADQYASAAQTAAADVNYRIDAQNQAVNAETQLRNSGTSLVRTRTASSSSAAMTQATATHTAASSAEQAAQASATAASSITSTSSQRPAGDLAAAEASVAGELARANSDDAMRHVTSLTAGEAKIQHDLADAADEYSTADEYAGNARTLAERAWAAVDLIDDANAEDLAAATERANITQAYADLAGIYAEETRQRELAQGAASQASNQLQQASQTTQAEDARPHVVEARNQATAAEAARDAIAASIADREATFGPDARANDQLARAEAAAQQARADALTAEQYAMATQAMLDEQLAIIADPVVDLTTGEVRFTFADNPNDTRETIDYTVTANRGDVITPGQVTENTDGTVSVVFPAINGPVDAATVFTITPFSWERTSENPTLVAPVAPTAVELQALLTMPVASTGNPTCESNLAPGALQGEECVGTKPLAYDTAALEYETRAYQNESYVSGYACARWEPHQTEAGLYNCVAQDYGSPIYSTRRAATPTGFRDDGSQWVSLTPNAQASRPARIDAAFTDTSWVISGGRYVAVSPLPAADFNDTVTYTYESGLNTYVTRNTPDQYNTYRPVFTSLPATVTGWTVKGETHTDLDGQDTGRTSTPITVHTLGGNVTINADVFTTDQRGSNHYRP